MKRHIADPHMAAYGEETDLDRFQHREEHRDASDDAHPHDLRAFPEKNDSDNDDETDQSKNRQVFRPQRFISVSRGNLRFLRPEILRFYSIPRLLSPVCFQTPEQLFCPADRVLDLRSCLADLGLHQDIRDKTVKEKIGKSEEITGQ